MKAMGFEQYERSSRGQSESDEPAATVWSAGKIAFNEIAVEEWFDRADYVGVWLSDSTDRVVGVAPVSEDNRNSYKFSSPGTFKGRVLHATSLLKELNCSRPDQSEPVKAEWNEGAELVSIDLSPLAEQHD